MVVGNFILLAHAGLSDKDEEEALIFNMSLTSPQS